MEHSMMMPGSSVDDCAAAGAVLADFPAPPPAKEKKAKSKKHKKHHRHDRHNPLSALPASSGGLKIRIKVGGEETPSTAFAHKKKKKKDKKKKDKEKKHRHHHKEKRKREHTDVESEMPSAPETEFKPPPAKRANLECGSPVEADEIVIAPTVPIAAAVVEVLVPESYEVRMARELGKKKPLYKLLDYILPLLEKRDTHNFFAFPVSDKFAPGYSQIIKYPMDFSTMRKKLDHCEYTTLDAFKVDFELMCTNAMTYNTQDTIYYKTAKKLLSIGQRLLTPQKLIPMREQLLFMENLTEEELGFDIMGEMKEDEEEDEDEDAKDVSRVLEDIRDVVRRPPGRFEAIPDDLTSQEILEQVRKAADAAADRLRSQKPRSGIGYLQHNEDGTTSLNFLSGGIDVVPGTEDARPVSLGSLINKVKPSTVPPIQGIREDRCDVAKAIDPLSYGGTFSCQGANYESTFSNLTKEEMELVYSTYGDEVGVQYAESILNFSRHCDYAMFIVDHLLDILTGNEHRKTSKYIEEQKMLRKEAQLLDGVLKSVEIREASVVAEDRNDHPSAPVGVIAEPNAVAAKVDFNFLKSLSNEGIDTSFLDALQTRYESLQEPTDPASCLMRTASLLQQLKETQTFRLSQSPLQHFTQIPKPGQKELDLAEKIQSNLVDMTKQLSPMDVVPVECVRKMLGIPPGSQVHNESAFKLMDDSA